jgi:thiopurine S-methyltransferase
MTELSSDYWTKRYQNQQTGWDLGEVSPPLKAYFDQLMNKDLKILIPGCGYGHEGKYLWEHGFKNVHFADFSEHAIESISKDIPEIPSKQLHCINFFDINEKFDLIIEQTMFCAIDPKLRSNYVKKAAEILTDNGKMVGVLFNCEFESGPPFGGSKGEYEKLFQPHFTSIHFEDCHNSISPRMGSELFMIARK